MFQQFSQLVADASGWAYAVVLLLALLDALVPVVPSETAAITAGVVAASGDLDLLLVIATATIGAFLGDNIAYLIGRRFGGRVADRFFRGEQARKRIEWTEHQLEERGGEMIAVAWIFRGSSVRGPALEGPANRARNRIRHRRARRTRPLVAEAQELRAPTTLSAPRHSG